MRVEIENSVSLTAFPWLRRYDNGSFISGGYAQAFAPYAGWQQSNGSRVAALTNKHDKRSQRALVVSDEYVAPVNGRVAVQMTGNECFKSFRNDEFNS